MTWIAKAGRGGIRDGLSRGLDGADATATRRYGPAFLEALRQGMPAFAGGGLVGTVGGWFSSAGSAIGGFVGDAVGFLTDPASAIRSLIGRRAAPPR